jgi:hypothetical protein
MGWDPRSEPLPKLPEHSPDTLRNQSNTRLPDLRGIGVGKRTGRSETRS